jgi:murein DD-endopeptidase MepM/ murein hydrolase activator NlpD
MKVFFAQGHTTAVGSYFRILFGAFVLLTVAVGAGSAGFWYGQKRVAEGASANQTVALLFGLFARERAAIAQTKRESVAHLDALSGRVAQMQADVLRLNALGARLVQMASLNGDEFDFDNPAAVGGPEPTDSQSTSAAELTEEMDRLFSELRDRDRKLTLLEDLIMERDLQAESLPAGSPVRSGYVTSTFGFRKDPMNGRRSRHLGVDFAGKRGTDILAVADGLVVFTGVRNGYGNTLDIRHANGLVTRYAHNQKILVKEGDLVEKGQVVAKLGSSGRATGPHLHFEVLEDGEQVDPMKYVRPKRPTRQAANAANDAG